MLPLIIEEINHDLNNLVVSVARRLALRFVASNLKAPRVDIHNELPFSGEALLADAATPPPSS